ncbi:hypothetical protein DFO70_1309 [Cytobacillus firmus]|uniref:Uncharacterized protein n=2 Tax=Cytobacillus TaxID=2675230 RepID=A0A366JGY6_CYTFI|nr:hypothetical protein DFO70_1309 [Cytobacillus firmus]TDX45536.1 hypothetical protein DFO72_1024 [Cytobacillus oceanisediminis]
MEKLTLTGLFLLTTFSPVGRAFAQNGVESQIGGRGQSYRSISN